MTHIVIPGTTVILLTDRSFVRLQWIPVIGSSPGVVLEPGRARALQGGAQGLVVEVVDVRPVVAPGPVGDIVRIVKDVTLGAVECNKVQLPPPKKKKFRVDIP